MKPPPLMVEDTTLLRRYATERSEEAFAEVVRRHVDLVYSAALRQVNGAAHRAEEVTQSVFIDLARKAGDVARRADIVGWLYTSTHYAAAKLKRGEQRRQQREEEAARMHEIETGAGRVDWTELRPVLDEAMHELSASDREAILLRFFQGRRFAEVGARLGFSEDAARMRVERALEKLRVLLARRGIASSATALGLALQNTAVLAAPATLASAVTGAALAGATASFVTATAAWPLLAATGACAALALGGYALQARTTEDLRREIMALERDQRAAAALRVENQRLTRAADEIAALQRSAADLAALRREAVGLHVQVRNLSRPAPTAAPATQPAARYPGDTVRLHLPDADLTTVLSAYQIYSGKRIVRDASLAGTMPVVRVITGVVTVSDAMEQVEKALRDQAGVVLVPGPDNTMIAKRAAGGPTAPKKR